MSSTSDQDTSQSQSAGRLTWSKVLNAVVQAIIAAITALTTASCANWMVLP